MLEAILVLQLAFIFLFVVIAINSLRSGKVLLGIRNEILNSFSYYETKAKLKIECAQKRGMQEEIAKLKLESRENSRKLWEDFAREKEYLKNDIRKLERRNEQFKKIIDANKIPVVFE